MQEINSLVSEVMSPLFRVATEPIRFKDDDDSCTKDKDCSKYPFFVCDKKSECVHKDIFPPEALEIVGLFVFGIIMALCTVAGIGGGGIAISMLIAFWKFDTKHAVAISSTSILICTTMRFFYNFKQMNPEKPYMNCLDYGLASVMMPTTLAGSQIGGFILDIFPSLYIQIALTLLLAFLSFQTYRKAMQMHKKEKAAEQAKIEEGGADQNNKPGNDSLVQSDEKSTFLGTEKSHD